MIIKSLHISAFGPIVDRDIVLSGGLNIIEGCNEAGKSAVAMFIKFCLYGLSGRNGEGISERQQYVNWSRSYAGGSIVIDIENKGRIRIERNLISRVSEDGKVSFTEACVTYNDENEQILSKTALPGEELFGVPESVFVSTVFSSQEGDKRPDTATVKESIENMITSADENVSVTKAVALLDRERVKLRHKRGQGGDIFDLTAERDRIAEAFEKSRKISADVIRDEGSLGDTQRNIEDAKREKEKLDKLSEAIDVLTLRSKIEMANDAEKELSEAEKKAAEIGDKDTVGSIASIGAIAMGDLEKFKEKTEALKTAEKEYKEKFSDDGENKIEELEIALKKNKSGKTLLISALILLAFGVLTGAGAGVLYFLNKNGYVLPLVAATGVLLFAGFVILIIATVKKNYVSAVMEMYEDKGLQSPKDLGKFLYEQRDAEEAASDELDRMKIEVEAAGDALSRSVENMRLTAKKEHIALPHDGDAYDYAAVFEKEAEARRETSGNIDKEVANLRGKYETLSGQLKGIDVDDIIRRSDAVLTTKIGQEAVAMSDSEIADVSRRKTFVDRKLETLHEREKTLAASVAAMKAVSVSPAHAEEMLWDMNLRLEKMEEKYASYVLAMEALGTAGENIRSGTVPRLTAEVSSLLSGITDNAYDSISITPSFDIKVKDGEFGTKEVDYLSAGTKDALFISFRIALARALYNEEKRPPLVFDETLCRLDRERAEKAIALLSCGGVQTLLFTCRSLEEEVSADIPHTHIKL